MRVKLAVVCGSFAPELSAGLGGPSQRAEHSRQHSLTSQLLQLLSSLWSERGRSSLHGPAVPVSLGDETGVA